MEGAIDMFDSTLLKDKIILITGGGTGLGRAMGERFLTLGAKPAITSRREEVLAKAAAEMGSESKEVFYKSCDVRDPLQVAEMVAAVEQHYGRIDVLINNAAGQLRQPDRKFITARSGCGTGYRPSRNVLHHVRSGQKMDRAGRRRYDPGHPHHVRVDRRGLRCTEGGGEGGRDGDDALARRRVGEVQHPATASRPARSPPMARGSRLAPTPELSEKLLNRVPLRRVGEKDQSSLKT